MIALLDVRAAVACFIDTVCAEEMEAQRALLYIRLPVPVVAADILCFSCIIDVARYTW